MKPLLRNQKRIDPRAHLATFALAIWTAVLAYSPAYFLSFHPLGEDQSWCLYAAQHILAGAHPYGSQIVETNPPFILWFSILPVGISNLFHFDSYLALRLLVFLLIAASTAWCVRIYRVAGLAKTPASTFISVCLCLAVELFVSGYYFAEREQLVVIFILPFVLSALCGTDQRLSIMERCTLGVASGLAVCFKPQQVLVLIALEAFLAIGLRSLRRLAALPTICAVLTIFAYTAAVWIATPLYLTNTVPLLLKTFWAFGTSSIWSLVRGAYLFESLFFIAFMILILKHRAFRYSAVPGGLLACSLGAYLAYLSQHSNIPYKAVPAHAFLLFAILSIAIEHLPSDSLAGLRFNSSFAIALLLTVLALLPLCISILRASSGSSDANNTYIRKLLSQYPPGTPIYIFSANLSDGFPVVFQDHLVWASRFPFLWMLPAIIENQSAESGGPPAREFLTRASVDELAHLQRTETTDDLQRWKPRIVIVKKYSESKPEFPFGKQDFDPLPWFLKSPAFSAAWSNYRLQTHHGSYDVYTRIR